SANWQVELLGELKIALVMRWDGHDRTGSVANEDIIGDPDRDLLAVYRVAGIGPGEDARLAFRQIGAFEIALAGGLGLIPDDSGAVLGCRDEIDQRML